MKSEHIRSNEKSHSVFSRDRTTVKGSLLAGAAMVGLVSFGHTVAAQDEGSMQVGNATVSVGAGAAILDLPSVKFAKIITFEPGVPARIKNRVQTSDNFSSNTGLNIDGSIAVPLSSAKTISLNGFWTRIDDEHTTQCDSPGATICNFHSLFDGPNAPDSDNIGLGLDGEIISQRDVNHWGASLESKWQLNGSETGDRAAPGTFFAVGADIRGIDQEFDLVASEIPTSRVVATLNDSLDTRYYGGYVAWGSDYSLPFISRAMSQHGLTTSFKLRGGVYYADTDYDGVSTLGAGSLSRSLSLSKSNVAFIGGMDFGATKRLGRRAALSLKGGFDYYSYVPDMKYNDFRTLSSLAAENIGTSIGSADALSARASLRLTIKLGPDSVME